MKKVKDLPLAMAGAVAIGAAGLAVSALLIRKAFASKKPMKEDFYKMSEMPANLPELAKRNQKE
ncbi:MAG: hypothetical protein QW275_03545 [Candidatus Anstonellaceae archaeon]